jgi:PPK2 family polyphosphate:nucleotide phosphotransferase
MATFSSRVHNLNYQGSAMKNNRSGKKKAGGEHNDVTTAAAAPEELNGVAPIPNHPRYRVEPGETVKLADIDPNDTGPYRKKEEVKEELDYQCDRIHDLQERLYAEHKQSLLIVLQAMDTGGKDGTISHVFEGVNPQGCQVWSFKVPSTEELAHDFIWRYHEKAPPRGMITIFNRSQYEDVLVVRVKSLVPEDIWRERYDQINQFERMLARNDTTIIKFFLYISRDEQKRRLESRLEDPTKHWKFSSNDLKERAYWDEYSQAYEDAISKCSTAYAPWYVVPANRKWFRNLIVARTIADTLDAMNPQFPPAEEDIDQIEISD